MFGTIIRLKQKRDISKKKTEDSYTKIINKRLRRQCIIRHMNGNRVYWDFIIILLAVYNAFATPMEVAFKPPWLKSSAC